MDGSPTWCFEVVADIERYPEWVADLKEVHVHERDHERAAFPCRVSCGCFWTQHEATPWPTTTRRHRRNFVGSSGRVISQAASTGIYRFKSAPEGGTEVTYQLAVELRVPLPGFIKRRAEGNIIHAAIRDLKARVESTS